MLKTRTRRNEARALRLFQSAVVLIAIVVLAFCTVPDCAWGASGIDVEAKGSIRVACSYGGAAVPGGTLTLYQVAKVTQGANGGCFALTNGFENQGVDLEDFSGTTLAYELEGMVSDSATFATKVIDADGEVVFPDLPAGVYLLVQDEAPSGYAEFDPFLVVVPLEVGGAYTYDVEVSPKLELLATQPAAGNVSDSDKALNDPSLPQTGLLLVPVFGIVGIGVLLALVGYILVRAPSKRKQGEIEPTNRQSPR